MTMRSDIIKLCGKPVIGIELGVAEGVFSSQVLEHQDVEHWYSVDMWAGDRGHDLDQKAIATNRLKPYKHKNTIIHSKFNDCVNDFEDEYFDIIYIDGYAHTGQEGGKTLEEWWPKLKPGGVFAGDDYDPEWPLCQKAVDDFCGAKGLPVRVHKFDEQNHWSRFPSWYTIKPMVTLDHDKKYTGTYEFVHFADSGLDHDNKMIPNEQRAVYTVYKEFRGYPKDIADQVKYYMGHYGPIQGKLTGELHEITN